ncbi:hypothetical protein B0H17DRAFT_1076149 [Mycena rosella]|uniref:Uncharacterized protein n=1 Tax=Mycena rosella TaxID=1033263 RepID=A0AAD7D6F5_MYCRO|nr:hypothetical protein B0H17DRAFT_1076149 [Mycena rosella]
MASRIPDEILHEILSPALKVPEEAFSATSIQSPFSRDESSSAFLLVSKSWLRVATPLLYNVVIIRSKAQAQVLAIVFRANPDLGRFVRKLRVEGGYAISMHKILQTSKNITDLFITVNITSADNTCGLCRGLPSIDPARVIIDCSPAYYPYKGCNKLVDVLKECIQKWKNLTVVQVSHASGGPLDVISRALRNVKSLDTLVISDKPYHELFQEREIPKYISIIAANRSLQHIQLNVQPRGDVTRSNFYKELQKDVRLEALFNLPPPTMVSATTPFIYPASLAADPSSEDLIWSRVLYYVLCRSHLPDSWSFSYDFDYSESDDDCGPLASLLVSKKFARLGIPHLYESAHLETTLKMKQFTERLMHQPSLGPLVRHLSIRKCYGNQDVISLVSHTPSLVSLRTDLSITWKMFNNLCQTTGSSLRDIRVSVAKPTAPTAPMSPGIFSLLPQIHYLAWDCKTVFKTGPKSISAGTLAALVDLSVEAFDPSFLTVLLRMELPSLRSVTFGAESTGGDLFLQKYGKKLLQLTVSARQMDPDTFRFCPSLTTLGISCYPKNIPSPDSLKLSETHACLTKIVFKRPRYPAVMPTEESKMMLMFRDVDRRRFPALREIQHHNCCWPTTDRATTKSFWASWAEMLLERDIRLIDKQGVGWRSRLKFTKKVVKKR